MAKSSAALAYRRTAREAARTIKPKDVTDQAPSPHVLKARSNFGYFCQTMGLPPPPHMREWYRVFLTGESNDHLSYIAGPDVALLSPRGPLDPQTPVATPSGWRPLADLSVGDSVFAGDGTVTQVTNTVDYPESPCWRVVMSDGTSVVCDDSHRWQVRRMGSDPKGAWRVVTLEEIRTLVTTGITGNRHTGIRRTVRRALPGETPWLDSRGYARYQVPVSGAVEYPAQSLPLDPYLLGVLIGDGSLSSGDSVVRITSVDEDLIQRCRSALPGGMTIKGLQGARYGWSIVSVLGRGRATQGSNQVVNQLRKLGLMGKRAWEKSIPALYLQGSIDQRVALLQGLMDTDGTRGTNPGGRGGLSYCSTSKQLIEDIAELVRSLGGIARYLKPYASSYRNTAGEKVPCRLSYRVSIRLPQSVFPFWCQRKRAAYTGPSSPRSNAGLVRSIVGIEPVAPRPVRCISVAHPDELFLTKDYLVVKNSAKSTFVGLLLAWLIGKHALDRKLLRILYVSFNVEVARSKSAAIKTTIQDPSYQEIFPNVRLSKTRSADEYWAIDFQYAGIDVRGEDAFTIACAGLKGTITSKRSSLIVVDDAIKSEEAIKNPDIRREMEGNWNKVIMPTKFEGGRVIALGTRFHFDDMFATTFVEKNGFQVITQAALSYDEDGRPSSYWPEMWSVRYLLKRQSVDEIAFAYQYMNRPIRSQDLGISPLLIVTGDVPDVYDTIGVGIDLSSGVSERNDWTVFTLGGRLGDRASIIDMRRLKAMGNLEKLEALCEMLVDNNLLWIDDHQRFRPTTSEVMIWPESVAYQKSFEGDFKRIVQEEWGLFNLKVSPVRDHRGDKLAKFRSITGLLQTRKVTFNRYRNWDVMTSEIVNLGHASHDDCPDSLRMLLQGLMRRGAVQVEYEA